MQPFLKRFRSSRPLSVSPDFTAPLLVETECVIVGDVHGRFDLLKQLLTKDEFKEISSPHLQFVFVGDYIDRGEKSADVLRYLMALDQSENVTCLMGNHEKMMLDFLDNPAERGRRWLRYGGLQTLASFGIGGMTEAANADSLTKAAGALGEALGPKLERWVRALKFSYQNGNMIAVHAALDPNLPLGEQEKSTLLWGHREFFNISRTDDLWVVHGHTAVDQPTVLNGKVSLDTGAYYSGRLTAAILLPNEAIQFIDSK